MTLLILHSIKKKSIGDPINMLIDLWHDISLIAKIIVGLDLFLFIGMTVLRKNIFDYLETAFQRVKSLEPKTEALNPRRDEWIVEILKEYKESSKKLEAVNTIALIDKGYSQATYSFISHKRNIAKEYYLFEYIPTLLLSLGLFGTFWGISESLISLSNTLSTNGEITGDINTIINEITPLLRSMSTAFVSSLGGLVFNILLSGIVYPLWDTNLSRDRLLSCIEDYLDNKLKPTIDGLTRLDKVVDKMNDNFENFLNRFGETVRGAIDTAMRDKIQEIVDVTKRAAELTIAVQSSFEASSITFSNSAHIYQSSIESLRQSNLISNLIAFSRNLDENQIRFGQSVNLLHSSFEELRVGIELLTESGQIIQGNSENIRQLSETVTILISDSHNIFSSIGQIQNSLGQTSTNFYRSINQFDQLIISMDQSNQRIHEKSEGLIISVNNFTEVLLDQHTKVIELFQSQGEDCRDSFLKSFQELLGLYQNNSNQFESILSEIKNLANQFQAYFQVLQTMEKKAKSLIAESAQSSISEKSEPENKVDYSKIFKEVEPEIRNNDFFSSKYKINILLAQFPHSPEIHYLAAQLEEKERNPGFQDRVCEHLRKAIKSNKDDVRNKVTILAQKLNCSL